MTLLNPSGAHLQSALTGSGVGVAVACGVGVDCGAGVGVGITVQSSVTNPDVALFTSVNENSSIINELTPGFNTMIYDFPHSNFVKD